MSTALPRRLWSWFRTSVLGRKSVQDVGTLSAANAVSAALLLLQGLLLARWLGPQHYGTAALVLAYPYLVSGFLSPRSKEVSVKYLSEFHGRGDGRRVLAICKLAMALDVLVALVTFFIVLLSAGWAAERFTRDPEMAILMIVVSGSSVVSTLAGTSYAVLATLRRFELIAGLNVMTSALNTGLMLTLVFCGWSVAGVAWGAALAAVGSGLVYTGVTAVVIHRTWGGSPLSADLSVLSGRVREIAGHFAYNHLSRVFLSVLGQLDLVVLGYFRGPTETGYYKLAKRIATVLWDLTTPLASVAYPAILRVVQGADDEAARQMIRKLALHLGLPLAALTLSSALLVPFALPILVGSAYETAAGATQILLVGAAVGIGFFWQRPLFFARGKFPQLFAIDSSIAVLSGIAYCIVVPLWGYVALAVWWTVAQILTHVAAQVWLWRSAPTLEHAMTGPGSQREIAAGRGGRSTSPRTDRRRQGSQLSDESAPPACARRS